MPKDVTPVFDDRQAKFDCYQQFVSEAIDADKEGGSFVVGLRGRDVVAVNLANERENVRTFMDVARRYPAVKAELDGGYAKFLEAIGQSAHKDNVGLGAAVASALSCERKRVVPLRSRRILDVNNFLTNHTPIPDCSEGEFEDRRGVAPDTAQPSGTYACEGGLPSSIDTAALAESWVESSRRELPKLSRSEADIEDRMVRQHFLDAVGSAALCLKDRQDPRSILAHWQSQIADMSGSDATPEFVALGKLRREFTAMLEALSMHRAAKHRRGMS